MTEAFKVKTTRGNDDSGPIPLVEPLFQSEMVSPVQTLSHVDTFSHVDTWVFDLDNTLYPPDSALWPQIDNRITSYIMELYGQDGLTARALQKHFYHRYGTTLKALMDQGHGDVDEFLSYVHDIDRSSLVHNSMLSDALGKLPGRKLILTNGSRKHAEDTAQALGILEHFEDIFDIKAAGFVPKPDRIAYDIFFNKHGVDPKKSAMFEDLVKNLEVPYNVGMKTVLIVPKSDTVDLRDAWEQNQATPPFVEYVTNDIADFLYGIETVKSVLEK
jgi:putative hydrolase of the HAD superfamily